MLPFNIPCYAVVVVVLLLLFVLVLVVVFLSSSSIVVGLTVRNAIWLIEAHDVHTAAEKVALLEEVSSFF